MTDVDIPVRDGLSGNAAGPLAMISLLAISAGIAAAPAQAQDMTASPALVQPAPVIAPQPAPAAEPAPTSTETRADGLANEGGFDAATVAPEALAQIEREQQARKDAAAAAAQSAAAARAAAARSAPARTTGAAMTDSAAQAAPALDAGGATALAQGTADPVAVIPMISPVAESAAAPAAMPADSVTDWSLLAALAAMLGIGGAGAYAATRRRTGKTRQTAALNAAIMPELSRDSVKEEIRRKMDAAQPVAQPTAEDRLNAKMDLAEFVATLPECEALTVKADRTAKLGQRRVAAAPRPYLGEADPTRPTGYFTAHVDAMPTPQNPFLTRHNRLKRARYLDAKLAEGKVTTSDSRTRIVGTMKVARPMEPAFA